MKYLLANWKMYLSVEESVKLAKAATGFEVSEDKKIVLFPSALAFTDVVQTVSGKVDIGAQDAHWDLAGAETGEVSMKDVKDAGATYVLVGHSERREDCDTDEIVAKKLKAAIEVGLTPVLCIGESKEECEGLGRDSKLEAQLTSALKDVEVKQLFVAYEPIWAIGTGENDPPEDVSKAAKTITKFVESLVPGAALTILYGGSVDPQNVAQYTGLPGVEGVLVGSASTKSNTLKGIWEAL
jgi:triosephosphate isomerase